MSEMRPPPKSLQNILNICVKNLTKEYIMKGGLVSNSTTKTVLEYDSPISGTRELHVWEGLC